MAKRFSEKLLYRIRNEVPLASLLRETLQQPCKKSEGYDRFLCPRCGEFNTAINPKNNLGRCFRCEENFAMPTSISSQLAEKYASIILLI